MSQVHKTFNDDQATMILQWYEDGSLTLESALERLGCKRSRFFELVKRYRKDPDHFTIQYPKRSAHNKLDTVTEKIIREELKKDQELIKNPNIPIRYYNYSAIRDAVVQQIQGTISAQTVRNRAKAWGYMNPKRQKVRHDREVETTAVGMLLQHDTSHHLWSPFASEKWPLITTIDDYSRKLLYGDFVDEETTWAHISGVESVVLQYGVGLAYYVDSHAIFRFVCHQESIWHHQVKGTDDIDTQWKRVVKNCGMNVWHASSPQAKGKIERPYRWLQDRVVRRCAKDGITTIDDARMILQDEITRYNEQQVHSTTREIPEIRFQKAIQEGKSVLKPLQLSKPYTSTKDIFCLEETRAVNNYGKISWNSYHISLPNTVPTGSRVLLKIIPDPQSPEIRVWYQNTLVKVVRLTS